MKQQKWYLLILVLVLSSLLLDACSFSFEVMSPAATSESLSTPTFDTSISATLAPTFTPPPTTDATVLPTPTLISIRADTIPMLEVVSTFQNEEIVRGLAFTPDGTVLASAGGNDSEFAIHVWDVVNGQPLGTLEGHDGIVWGVAFSPDGSLLASVSSDQTAKIWDWHNKALVQTLSLPARPSVSASRPMVRAWPSAVWMR